MEELERGEDRLLHTPCGADARQRLIFQVLGRWRGEDDRRVGCGSAVYGNCIFLRALQECTGLNSHFVGRVLSARGTPAKPWLCMRGLVARLRATRERTFRPPGTGRGHIYTRGPRGVRADYVLGHAPRGAAAGEARREVRIKNAINLNHSKIACPRHSGRADEGAPRRGPRGPRPPAWQKLGRAFAHYHARPLLDARHRCTEAKHADERVITIERL